MSQQFLQGENINHVLSSVHYNLSQMGVNWDFKNDEDDIQNFMRNMVQRAPAGWSLSQLNAHTIQALSGHYMQNQPARENVSNRYEEELSQRRYDQFNNQQSMPPGLESMGVAGAGGMVGTGGPGGRPGAPAMDQLRQMGPPPPLQTSVRQGHQTQWPTPQNNDDVQQAAEQERMLRQQGNLLSNDSQRMVPTNGTSNRESGFGPTLLRQGQPSTKWLSLQKDHLVDLAGNVFTFGWQLKNSADDQLPTDRPVHLRIEYITLPKYFPYLMLKFGKERYVFNGQGRGYSAKLIPVHHSGENTTYQIIGQGFSLSELPNNLTIGLSTPDHNSLDLNLIRVQRVVKQNSKISIFTRYPHHLQPTDSLILEFPDQSACYKMAQVEIVDPYHILVDSPFSGYFSPNFRVIRDNWDLDVTISIT